MAGEEDKIDLEEIEIDEELESSDEDKDSKKESKKESKEDDEEKSKKKAESDDDSEEDDEEEESDEEDDEEEKPRRKSRSAEDDRISKLEAALAALALKQVESAKAEIDRQISVLDDDLAKIKAAKKLAYSKGDWDAVEKFDDAASEIRASKERALIAKEQAAKPAQKDSDGYRTDLARKWAARHDWFDPRGNDKASKAVRELSAKLEEEGYDVSKPAHYKELTTRLKRRMPHLFRGEGEAEKATRKKPVQSVASGGGAASGGGKKSVSVPKALIENFRAAGFDVSDPEVRKKIAKRYMESKSGRA